MMEMYGHTNAIVPKFYLVVEINDDIQHRKIHVTVRYHTKSGCQTLTVQGI